MSGRTKPHALVLPDQDQDTQEHVQNGRIGKKAETLTDAMRRVSEEARKEISKVVKDEAEKAPG